MTRPSTAVRAEIQLRGRTIQAMAAVTVFCVFAVAVALFWIDVAASGVNPRTVRSTPALALLGVLLAAFVAVRVLAVVVGAQRYRIEAVRAADAEPAAVAPAPDGTVICCSGGGVKSAAFCLGALQQLTHLGIYQRATAIVGVSGGAYIAGAFATRSHRTDARGPVIPFPTGGPEVAALRRNTNYLASSQRVRYDLGMSFLLGFVVNLVNIYSALVMLGWLLAMHADATGLALAPDDGGRWTFDPGGRSVWWLFLPSAILLVLSVAIFLAVGSRPEGAGPLQSLRGRGRALDVVADEVSKRLRGTPNALVLAALGLPLFYPGVPYLAVWANGHLADVVSGWRLPEIQVAALLSVLGAVASLARSTVKGTAQVDEPSSRRPRLMRLFRRRVAPVAGIALVAFLAYAVLVGATTYALSHPPSGHIVLILAGVSLLVTMRLGSANRTSLFPFYRSRLAAAYLDVGPHPASATVADGGRPVPLLADLAPARSDGVPELVLCATANVTRSGLLPTGRNGTPFVMGDTIGLTDPHLPGGGAVLPAAAYDRLGLPLDVATAVAISGAAIAPIAGRETKTIGSSRILLALFNIRLGVWVPNPYWSDGEASVGWRRFVVAVSRVLDRPTPYHVIQEAVQGLSPFHPHLYVTDGGHYDNLGLVEALRRRPQRIVVLDGSGDAEDHFGAMGNAIATARMDLGAEVEFDPTAMQRRGRGSRRGPTSAWVRAAARFPDGAQCRIDYVKCVLPAGQSWDLYSYQQRNPGFPAVTTRYELFDEFDFEAFRQLGWSLTAAAAADDWAAPEVDR